MYRRCIVSSVVWSFGFGLLCSSSLLFAEATPLIQGDALDNWEKKGGKATYELQDGVIVGTSAPHSPNTFLCTKKEYGDFELTYEFKCDKALNSGVQFRSQCFDEPTEIHVGEKKVRKVAAGRVHGYQAEIDPNKPERCWVAGIYDEGRRGWVFPGKRGGDGAEFTTVGKEAFKPGEWNSVKIVCKGDHIQTWLNGTLRADFKDDMTLKGFIALQVHGVGGNTEPLKVRFRNIMIEEFQE